jgi:4a-hydroxytetrahydrobiopterin dehydratase
MTPAGWTEADGKLRREFTFADFTAAFAFMTQVAFLAERADHHPNWSNVYNRVTIDLCTHDEGHMVTDKDRELANGINSVLSQWV